MEYLHLFNTDEEFRNYRQTNYIEPWVSATLVNGEYRINYNKTLYEILLETPITFEISNSGNIVWKSSNSDFTRTIEYKKNDGEWTSIISNTDGVSIPVVSNDIVQFRGNNTEYGDGTNYCSFGSSTADFNVKGNIMSLIDSTDFSLLDELTNNNTFLFMFRDCATVIDASQLILPVNTLSENCYKGLFYGCTNLVKAPELPATILATSCYQAMFYQSGIINTPILPATIGVENCYRAMFMNCNNLINAAELPIETVGPYCCYRMFYGCVNLKIGPSVLPAIVLSNNCYQDMFNSCQSLITAPALPATTLANACYQGMFSDCRHITSTPDLLATTLVDNCYRSMFKDCINLKSACSLPATTLASYCYAYMFQGCSELINIPSVLPATTLADRSYLCMFRYCADITTAPELPATTLTTYCYQYMFDGCSKLNYIKCLATDISASNCLTSWVSNVSDSGTFIKNSAMNNWTSDANGIPANWTIQNA